MYVLGVETSCDETSCAVIKGRRVLSNVTVSSLVYHKKYGGIVPEIATRNHLKFVDRVFALSLKKAKITLDRLGLVGVTYRPGLRGALMVGLNFSQALRMVIRKPFLGIDHLHAHLFAPFLNNRKRFSFPFIGLIVSGGHTEIFFVRDFDDIRLIGKTRDDACGETFDKVARMFGLGYPGGVYIDKIFSLKEKNSIPFTCPRLGFDFSFSGIKTAAMYKKMDMEKKGLLDGTMKKKILSSFQESIVRVVVRNVCEAALVHKVSTVVCGGGVTANRRLRELLEEEGNKHGLRVCMPEGKYTTDNAAMVAGLAFYLYNNKGKQSLLSLKAGV